MSKDELLDALCPEPDAWEKMDQKAFQSMAGKCFWYLLHQDQKNRFKNTASSFIGGVIGGFLAFFGIKGVA